MEPETDPLVEALAAYAHEAWSGWMKYLFHQSPQQVIDGTVVIPSKLVERWYRQMSTPYADLPESEKESDRAEAREMLEVIASIHGGSAKAKETE